MFKKIEKIEKSGTVDGRRFRRMDVQFGQIDFDVISVV
jgi:hypothetical protein